MIVIVRVTTEEKSERKRKKATEGTRVKTRRKTRKSEKGRKGAVEMMVVVKVRPLMGMGRKENDTTSAADTKTGVRGMIVHQVMMIMVEGADEIGIEKDMAISVTDVVMMKENEDENGDQLSLIVVLEVPANIVVRVTVTSRSLLVVARVTTVEGKGEDPKSTIIEFVLVALTVSTTQLV